MHVLYRNDLADRLIDQEQGAILEAFQQREFWNKQLQNDRVPQGTIPDYSMDLSASGVGAGVAYQWRGESSAHARVRR